MLAHDTVFDRHRAGVAIYGVLNSIPSPLLCEMMGRAQFDYVILDLEHLLRSEDDVLHCIRACELAGVEPWVRVPDAEPKRIGRLLDNGAAAIVLPQVRSIDEVKAAVAASHFPPAGTRGITGGRPTGFGRMALTDYVQSVNRRAFIVPMLETHAGIRALPDILATAGIAGILEGALDLALDLGLGPDPQHSHIAALLLEAADLCRSAGVPFIANPRSDEQQAAWQERQQRFFLAGEDRGIILSALTAQRAKIQVR